jgi:hypothetical protein
MSMLSWWYQARVLKSLPSGASGLVQIANALSEHPGESHGRNVAYGCSLWSYLT